MCCATFARLHKRPAKRLRESLRYAAAPVSALLALALWSSLGEVRASAAPAPIVVGGEPCPGASLEERVRPYVTADQQARAGLAVDGHLRRSDDGQWVLDLEIARGDDSSVRQLVAPHCETVLDAAAFVVAVAIDPSLASTPLSEPPVPEPATIPPPVPVDTQPRTSATSTTTPATAASTTADTPSSAPLPRKRNLYGIVRAGGGLDFGALPRAGAMLEGAAGVGGRWFRAEVTGLYRLQTTQHAAKDPLVGGRFSMWAFGGRGCGVPRVGRVEFPLCAGVEGGRMIAQGFGLPTRRTVRVPWGAATIGPGLAWKPHKNVALIAQVALGVPFVRARMSIENLGSIHRTGPVFGRLWFGFEGRFP